jgi:hypothetical protein
MSTRPFSLITFSFSAAHSSSTTSFKVNAPRFSYNCSMAERIMNKKNQSKLYVALVLFPPARDTQHWCLKATVPLFRVEVLPP